MAFTKNQFTKNVSKVLGALRKNKDGSVTVLKPLTLHVPQKFQTKKFIDISDRVKVLASYALVLENKYFAMDSATTMFETNPSMINNIIVDDEPYFELVYEPNDLLVVKDDVLIDKELVYPVSTEFFSNGRLPWYFESEEIIAIYPNLEQFNGVDLRSNMTVYSILLSMMQRNPKDINLPFRTAITTKDSIGKLNPIHVGMNKVDLIVTGTLAKLGGPYLNPSITAALNVESTELSETEWLLRV